MIEKSLREYTESEWTQVIGLDHALRLWEVIPGIPSRAFQSFHSLDTFDGVLKSLKKNDLIDLDIKSVPAAMPLLALLTPMLYPHSTTCVLNFKG